MVPKIIKNDTAYEAALARIDVLMDAEPDTPAGDELELLVTLVELYEKNAHPIDLPEPVAAIKFRMEQQGLKPKDLVPFIGSRSKVSEVLTQQRPLSLAMIRRLHEGLGIPAAVLLREAGASLAKPLEGVDWERFPLAEILKRNWLDFSGTSAAAKKQAEEIIRAWAGPLGANAIQPALLKQHVRSGGKEEPYALTAWKIRVSLLALEQKIAPYVPGSVTSEFVRDLIRLSYLDNGPALAREFLHKSGIHLVIEGHLSQTHLDGAAIRLPDGSPLVALTIRHDRLDNFWFTLCHELAHVALHLDGEDCEAFFDDLEQTEIDTYEKAADRWALENLIPADRWREAGMDKRPISAERILDFATGLRISPAIPAGRIRCERKDFRIFTKLVGYKQVRRQFSGFDTP
jgi:HTH-type transcriptional regulator/antitoxin HigA